MFHLATYSHPDNCPKGGNGTGPERDARILESMGYTEEEIAALQVDDPDEEDYGSAIVLNRGRVNGKPANVITYPLSVPDPEIEIVAGPYAYGFDLDGKEDGTAKAFVDPETQLGGVDNEAFRAVGCFPSYDLSLPVRPQGGHGLWEIMMDSMPAWLFTITGDDLSRDGPVTVNFYKATQHMRRDALARPLRNATYLVDPGSRSHGTFHGQIKDNVLTVSPSDLLLVAEPPLLHELDLTQAQLRLSLQSDDQSIGGWVGGYIPWRNLWFEYSVTDAHYLDEAGLYHALRNLADGPLDPGTGERQRISATFRIEATPVFIGGLDSTMSMNDTMRLKAISTGSAVVGD